jgi:hypothetical protein
MLKIWGLTSLEEAKGQKHHHLNLDQGFDQTLTFMV